MYYKALSEPGASWKYSSFTRKRNFKKAPPTSLSAGRPNRSRAVRGVPIPCGGSDSGGQLPPPLMGPPPWRHPPRVSHAALCVSTRSFHAIGAIRLWHFFPISFGLVLKPRSIIEKSLRSCWFGRGDKIFIIGVPRRDIIRPTRTTRSSLPYWSCCQD